MEIDITVRRRATHLASDLGNLYSLNNIWDDYFEQAHSVISDDETNSLQLVTNDMREILIESATESRWLLSTIGHQFDLIDHEYHAAVGELSVSEYVVQQVAAKASGSDSIARWLHGKFAGFPDAAEANVSELTATMQAIRKTSQVPPMVRDAGYICAVGAGMVLGGALSKQLLPFGVGLIIMAAEC